MFYLSNHTKTFFFTVMEANKIESDLIRLQKNMYNFAYSLTLNKYDAEDLLQETSLRVLDNREKYAHNTNFKGWVLTIMKNLFINNYRRIVCNQTFIDTTDELYHLNLARELSMNPESLISTKEITQNIDKLPFEYGKPFKMHIAGFKYEEIAQKMNLPIGTVKSRIFAARKRLQRDCSDYK